MIKNKDALKKLFLIMYIFLILYAPPIIKNVNTLLIVFIFTLLVLIFKYRSKVICILKSPDIKKIGILFAMYFGWYAISIILNFLFYKEIYIENIIMNLYSMGLVIPISLVCVLFLLIYSQENNFKFNTLLKYTIYAGTIQGIICLLSFLFPPIKEFLLNTLYALTNDKLFLDPYHTSKRFYGYSNGMVDAFGFGSGIIACLPLFYSLFNGKKYLMYIPLLLLIIILNSRTGIIIFGIGVLIWFLSLLKQKRIKEYRNIIIVSIIIIIFCVLLINLIKPQTIQWIVTDFMSFFTDKKFGTADILFSKRFWRIPEGIRIIIGCGYSVAGFGGMTQILGFNSDVGYINEIWRTGLIGLIILISTLVYICYLLIKKYKSKYSYFFIFSLISLLVGNIKLIIFIYNPGIIIILMFVLYELFFKEIEKQKHLKLIEESPMKLSLFNQDKLISIIVPVYNTQNYLRKCLDSLINQTYKNLEIILINDGSTDGSLEICNEYKKIDNRIIVIDKKNEGQAIARNRGLDVAKGEYIGFVDSDDWVDLDTFEYLFSIIVKYNSDCSFIKIRRNDYDFQIKEIDERLYYGEDILIEYLKYGMKTGEYSLSSYLFDKKLLSGLRFPDGQVNEDIPYIFSALSNAKMLVKSNKHCYNYRMSSNSTTRNQFTEKDMDLIKACDYLYDYSKNKCSIIKRLVIEKRDRSDFSLLAKIAYYGISDEKQFENEISIMKENIRKNYFELMISNMGFIRKIQLTCFVINYDFSRNAINLIKEIKNKIK